MSTQQIMGGDLNFNPVVTPWVTSCLGGDDGEVVREEAGITGGSLVLTCRRVWCCLWQCLQQCNNLHCFMKWPGHRQFMHRLLDFRVAIFLSCGNLLVMGQSSCHVAMPWIETKWRDGKYLSYRSYRERKGCHQHWHRRRKQVYLRSFYMYVVMLFFQMSEWFPGFGGSGSFWSLCLEVQEF